MNQRRRLYASIALSLACAGGAQAAGFSYHGRLQDGGRPAEGSYDIELTVYADRDGGKVVAGPLTLFAVPVHQGAFDTEADFGLLRDAAAQGWVGTRVRAAGSGEFAALSARAPLAASATASVCPGAWTLVGNAGNPGSAFLGTTDAEPLSLDVNNLQVGQLAASTVSGHLDSPNVKFGASGNSIGASLYAVSIGAGGDGATTCGGLPCTNSATGNAATIAGGVHNHAAKRATVGGGVNNDASDLRATIAGGVGNVAGNATVLGTQTIGGGTYNSALGQTSTISGGNANFAEGDGSTVAGGVFNEAAGRYSAIPGGRENFAGGDYSMALGASAATRGAGSTPGCAAGRCGDFGSFVWADVQGGNYGLFQFASSGANQFLVRAGGGAAINTRPFNSNVEFTITGSGTAGNADDNVDLIMLPRNATQGFDLVASGTTGSHAFSIYDTNAFFKVLNLDSSGNLTIPGNLSMAGLHAYKGGSLVWESSDRRIKQDIVPIAAPLDRLMQLRPVTFHYTAAYRAAHGDFDDQAYFGFVAQEYAGVFPHGVSSDGEAVPGAAAGDPPVQSVDIQPALITTVGAVQERARESSDLRQENDRLRSEVRALAARLDRLEAREH
jgi:hypothetical protein